MGRCAPPTRQCRQDLPADVAHDRIRSRMKKCSGFFLYVSAQGSGNYFDVTFSEVAAEDETEACDHGYFLLQRQFVDDDGGSSIWNAPVKTDCAVSSRSCGRCSGVIRSVSKSPANRLRRFVPARPLQALPDRPCIVESRIDPDSFHSHRALGIAAPHCGRVIFLGEQIGIDPDSRQAAPRLALCHLPNRRCVGVGFLRLLPPVRHALTTGSVFLANAIVFTALKALKNISFPCGFRAGRDEIERLKATVPVDETLEAEPFILFG